MGKEVWYTFLHILKNTEQKKPKPLDDLEELKFLLSKTPDFHDLVFWI